MFVSKRKYNELLEQKKDFERIANNVVAQNGRLLDQWQESIEKMKEIQEFNHALVGRNEELSARCREFEAKQARQVQHIQLADDTIFAIEDALYRQKGDGTIQLHIDEYYEEVKHLDTK